MWFFDKKNIEPSRQVPEKDLFKKVRQIQIRSRKIVNDVMAGEYQSAFKGRGMEFDTVREYQEGDEIRMIDWNVTARLGYPYVKSYIEERELTVFFLVDISASGLFGSVKDLKKEVAAEFCAVLAFNAMKNNDRVGLILFSDQIELYVPPKKGNNHVLRIIRELLYFKPQHRKTSINSALEYFNRANKKKAVTFLVSDFFDKNYEKNLLLTNKRHDLVAVEIYDQRETAVSQVGLLKIEDPETGEQLLIDSNSEEWQHYFRLARLRFDEKNRQYFNKHGIDHLKIRTDKPFEHDLVKFFTKRSIRR